MKRARYRATARSAAAYLLFAAFGACSQQSDRSQSEPLRPSTEDLPFVESTDSHGLGGYRHVTGAAGDFWFPESMGPGVGFIDHNNDGYPDLLAVGGGTWDKESVRAVWLFENVEGRHFRDVTDEVGLAGTRAYGMGVAVADYNADGLPDFLLTTLNGVRLFRNDAGAFSDVTDAAGLRKNSWSTSAAFFDGDRDGDVDLLVGNYIDWSPETDIWCSNDGRDKTYCTPALYQGQPLAYYENVDRGRFRLATGPAGFGVGRGKTLGIVAFDFDADDDVDVFVANDTEPDQLFVNRGDGTFDERGLESGIAFDERGQSRAGMGIDIGVVDDTGEPTLFVGNFAEEMIGVYRHLGNGVFVDRAASSKIGLTSLRTLTFGLLLLDADVDGYLDLVAANGHIQPEIGSIRDNVTYAQAPHVFLNNGDGTFRDILSGSSNGQLLARPLVARGAAAADVDGDGDADVAIVENGGPMLFWKNLSVDRGKKSITIRVRKDDHLSVVGASVTVFSGGTSQTQQVKAGGSYMSSSDTGHTFALASSTSVDSVVVRWPGGTSERFVPRGADSVLVLVQGQSGSE